MTAWRNYQQGILTRAGGWEDQDHKERQVIAYLETLAAKKTKDELDEAKRKTDQMANAGKKGRR
jgi:hypothetical protein